MSTWLNSIISEIKAGFSFQGKQFFDADWYRIRYRDVMGSRQSSWQHFVRFGIREGRMICQRDIDQWFDDDLLAEYATDFEQNHSRATRYERYYLGWLFARRYASLGQWEKAKTALDYSGLLNNAGQPSVPPHRPFGYQPVILWLQACGEMGEMSADQYVIPGDDDVSELCLLKANAAQSIDAWLVCINSLFDQNGLAPIALTSVSFDGLSHSNADARQGPLVSILMAARNAQATIQLALQSLVTQSYRNIEIIVIDDDSTDQTAEVVEQFARQDARIKMYRTITANGPFASRNIGLENCNGELITSHDADDWSHPQKIEKQVEVLIKQTGLLGCFSSWARLSDNLQFGGWDRPSNWASWIHKNTSSLMIRRYVYEQLGFWDEVRCNGDVEYVERIITGFGSQSLATVLPGVPLAFGRTHKGSLTSQSETHVLTTLKGLRFDYHQGFSEWHKQAESINDLYLPKAPKTRPFAISKAMQVSA